MEFSNCMYDDPIYARVINFYSYFLSFDLFSNECTAWCVGCPSVVAQYFYCATPSSWCSNDALHTFVSFVVALVMGTFMNNFPGFAKLGGLRTSRTIANDN
jgi:hypothetical protein